MGLRAPTLDLKGPTVEVGRPNGAPKRCACEGLRFNDGDQTVGCGAKRSMGRGLGSLRRCFDRSPRDAGCGGPSPVSSPAGADSLFFVLPKKSKQKKGAPEMAKASLNFRNRAETGKTRCAQTVPRLFSARLRKFKAPSRAGTSKAKPTRCGGERQCGRVGHAEGMTRRSRARAKDGLLSIALCGALNFCERAEKGRRLV